MAHAGIVYAPQQMPIGQLIRGLMLIYHVLSAEEMTGKIEFHWNRWFLFFDRAPSAMRGLLTGTAWRRSVKQA